MYCHCQSDSKVVNGGIEAWQRSASGNKCDVGQLCREVLESVPLILKFIARSAVPGKPSLYGATALQSCQIDQWLEFACHEFVSGPSLAGAVAAASNALSLRTFTCGYTLSIADLAAWGALLSAPMWNKVKNLPAAANLLRWFTFCSAQSPLAAAVSALNPRAAAAAATRVRPLLPAPL